MKKKYKFEKFKSFHEACDWISDDENTFAYEAKQICFNPQDIELYDVSCHFDQWYKAIEVETVHFERYHFVDNGILSETSFDISIEMHKYLRRIGKEGCSIVKMTGLCEEEIK